MYDDLELIWWDPCSVSSKNIREVISTEIELGNKKDLYMKDWFNRSDEWYHQSFDHYEIVRKKNSKEIISVNGIKMFPKEPSMKILCNYYVRKQYRATYPMVHHVINIPFNVKYAITAKIKEIWYTIHGFDLRHKRYIEATHRQLNASNLPLKDIPIFGKFKYAGSILYKNVMQEKFSFKVEGN